MTCHCKGLQIMDLRRSFLEAHGVEQLLVVAVPHDAGHGGINRAARGFHQIPLGRSLFDDTKVA